MKLKNHIFKFFLSILFITVYVNSWSQNLQDNVKISRHSVDNGGGRSSAIQYVLTGTIGQHDASVNTASDGNYFLTGGVWANATKNEPTTNDLIFANGFEKP